MLMNGGESEGDEAGETGKADHGGSWRIRSFEICPKQDGKPLNGWSGGGEW